MPDLPILDAIDGTLADYEMSADAMRWRPEGAVGEPVYPQLLHSPVAKAASEARVRRAERSPLNRFRRWAHRVTCLKCREAA